MGIGAQVRPAAAQGGVISPESGVVRAGTRYGYVILRKRTRRLWRRLPSLESKNGPAQQGWRRVPAAKLDVVVA
jgi:hypothetical protein